MIKEPVKGTQMTDRFDLEYKISKCNRVVDDIDDLMDSVLDSPKLKEMSADVEDYLHGSLSGIKELYEMRFEALWETYKNYLGLDNEVNDK